MKIMLSIPPCEWCGLLRQGHFNKSEIHFDRFSARNSLNYAEYSCLLSSACTDWSAQRKNKRTLWRRMFWTLLVTRVVRARSYEFNWYAIILTLTHHNNIIQVASYLSKSPSTYIITLYKILM